VKVHSYSALVASLFALTPTSLFGVMLIDHDSGWGPVLAVLVALPSLVALVAAYSRNLPFRIASLTAAFVASVPPMLALLASLYLAGIGMSLIPGVIGLLLASVRAAFKSPGVIPAIGAVLFGIAAGACLVLAWWPIIEAWVGRRGADEGIALGLALVIGGLIMLCLTALIFREPAKPSNSFVARQMP